MKREDRLAQSLRVAGVHAEVTAYRDQVQDGEITLLPLADGREFHVQVGTGYVEVCTCDGGDDGLGVTMHGEAKSLPALVALISKVRQTAT